jgi:hypothetical protein
MPISTQYRELLTRSIGVILRDDRDFESVVKKATGRVATVDYTNDKKTRYEQVHDVLRQLEKEETERWLLAFVVVFAHRDHAFRRLVFKASPSTLDSSIRLDEQVISLVAKLEEAFSDPPLDLRDGMNQKAKEFGYLLRQIEALILQKRLYERLYVIKARLGGEAMRDPKKGIGPIVDACNNAGKINDTEALDISTKLDDAELEEINKLGELAHEAKREFDSNKVESGRAVLQRLEQEVQELLSTVNRSIFDHANELSLSFLIDDPPVEFLSPAKLLEIPVRNLIPTVLARVLVRKVWQEASNELVLVKRLLEAGMITDSREFSEHWFALKSRIRLLTEIESSTKWSRDVNDCAKAVDAMIAGAIEPVLGKKAAFDIAPFEAYRSAFECGYPDVMPNFDFDSVGDINGRLREILRAAGIHP